MIAEIHGKISLMGSNLHDRREDQLTGDFFGAIRYLPFEIGLLPVLRRARPVTGQFVIDLPKVNGYDYEIEFWQTYDPHGEIDVLLKTRTRDLVCGIEVKYQSGLSSDDADDPEPDDPEKESRKAKTNLLVTLDCSPTSATFLILCQDTSCFLPQQTLVK